MNYKFHWKENNAVVTFEGDVKYNDIFLSDGKIYGDSRFDLMTYAIYDFSEVNNLLITEADLKILSVLNISASKWNKKLKVALIITSKNIADVLSIYIQLMEKSSWSIKIFNTREKAFEWTENE